MNPLYKFPEINHLDDVWPLVKDQEAFYLKDAGSYKVISYRTIFGNPFPNPVTLKAQIARECRGLVFSRTGELISRPFHKFMNLGEDQHSKDLMPHLVRAEDKLDGSLVRPVLLEGNVVWMTKGGHTDTAKLCESLIPKLLSEKQLAEIDYLLPEFTPLFEFVGPSNRHVVAYEQDSLKLLAVRANRTGAYMDLGSVFDLSQLKAKSIELTSNNTDYLKELSESFSEGIVGLTRCGHRVKVKNTSFVAMHRAKDSMGSELFVFNLVKRCKVDDVVSSGVLQEIDKQRLLRYNDLFWSRFDNKFNMLIRFLEQKIATTSRKDFAFHAQLMPKSIHGFLWEAYDTYHRMLGNNDGLDWVYEFREFLQCEYKTDSVKSMQTWKWFIDDLDWSNF